jgi:hypothetical protein
MRRLARLVLALLAAALLAAGAAQALPPADGSKCRSSWVDNPDAMACFIRGEEETRSGQPSPHYVACTSAGEIFCCVNTARGQTCEAVRRAPRGLNPDRPGGMQSR